MYIWCEEQDNKCKDIRRIKQNKTWGVPKDLGVKASADPYLKTQSYVRINQWKVGSLKEPE